MNLDEQEPSLSDQMLTFIYENIVCSWPCDLKSHCTRLLPQTHFPLFNCLFVPHLLSSSQEESSSWGTEQCSCLWVAILPRPVNRLCSSWHGNTGVRHPISQREPPRFCVDYLSWTHASILAAGVDGFCLFVFSYFGIDLCPLFIVLFV